MGLIHRLMSMPELAERPPVLVDVGASGRIHPGWRPIARYSVCVAFDPDAREMTHARSAASGFRKLHVIPAIVSDTSKGDLDFHLTRSPYCSSTLKPDTEGLKRWSFAPLFEVERTVRLPAVTLPEALQDLGLDRVDWFKCDSQGLDLRLFLSLGPAVISRVLAAEFEPGFIDAYVGDDRLPAMLDRLGELGFWLHRMEVKGDRRIDQADLAGLPGWQRRWIHVLLPMTPGWTELCFFNGAGDPGAFSRREWILAWVIATLNRQHGFGLHLARTARERLADPLFDVLSRRSRGMIARQALRLPGHIAAMLARLAIRAIRGS